MTSTTALDKPDLGPFDWADPFQLEQQLSEDERMLRDAANTFAQPTLQPRITAAYRQSQGGDHFVIFNSTPLRRMVTRFLTSCAAGQPTVSGR